MRELTERDVTMFHVMESMKRLSRCVDKQVVCLIVNIDGDIVSTGVNTIVKCDMNCHDKENRTCVVTHAEVMAIRHLDKLRQCDRSQLTAYVSLFPCKACQLLIEPYVREIVTFGMKHKEWVSDKIYVYGHPIYDALGSFAWHVEEEKTYASVKESITDEFLAETERAAKQRAYPAFYRTYNTLAHRNFISQLEDAGKNGLIACTKSNYDLAKRKALT